MGSDLEFAVFSRSDPLAARGVKPLRAARNKPPTPKRTRELLRARRELFRNRDAVVNMPGHVVGRLSGGPCATVKFGLSISTRTGIALRFHRSSPPWPAPLRTPFMTITESTTVADIASSYPSSVRVFQRPLLPRQAGVCPGVRGSGRRVDHHADPRPDVPPRTSDAGPDS